MVDEADACTILRNSLLSSNYLAWKMADPTGMFKKAIPRPFDMFGEFKAKPWYSEVKFLPKLESFNLQRIEEHQIENLCSLKERIPEAHCWITLAVRVGRGDNRFYIFDNPHDIKWRRNSKSNYLKKELETLPYLAVKKGLIDLTNYGQGGT